MMEGDCLQVLILTTIFSFSHCNFMTQMMTALSNTLNTQPRIDPSTLLSKNSPNLFAEEEEEIKNNVMLEVGLELLLKEPVFNKVIRKEYIRKLHYYFCPAGRKGGC